jgi:spore coat protein A
VPVSWAATPTIKRWVDVLPVPDLIAGTGAELSMVTATHQFSSSLPAVPTLAYVKTASADSPGDAYLGPTIVSTTDTTFTLTMHNAMGAHPLASAIDYDIPGVTEDDDTAPRASTHLHGGNTRPGDDGGPEDFFTVGDTHVYEYDNTQDATGLWYHDHALGITRLNVYAGLAGGYLIRDTPGTGIDRGDGALLPAGSWEVPLIIQDKTFNADGSLAYPPAPWAPEFFGDTAVVNGKAFPYLAVDKGVYRFRVFNGSQARFYQLNFKVKASGAKMPFLQIGSDGGLLNRPVQLTQLLLAPGERADLLVDFSGLAKGTLVEMGNSAPTPFPGGAHAGHRGGSPLQQIMQFQGTGSPGWTGAITTSTNLRPVTPIERLNTVAPAKTRTNSLVEVLDPAGMPVKALLNNRTFESTDYLSEVVAPNTLEVWEFVNTTVDAHPIHLHLVQFQVMNRQAVNTTAYLAATYDTNGNGMVDAGLEDGFGPYPAPSANPYLTGKVQAPAANEMGWKDTVVAPPGMVTRIMVPFGDLGEGKPKVAARAVYSPAAGDHDYVWHCHILEHEENDMMQYYRIG